MARLLLDTVTFLFAIENPSNLPKNVRTIIDDVEATTLEVSATFSG